MLYYLGDKMYDFFITNYPFPLFRSGLTKSRFQILKSFHDLKPIELSYYQLSMILCQLFGLISLSFSARRRTAIHNLIIILPPPIHLLNSAQTLASPATRVGRV